MARKGDGFCLRIFILWDFIVTKCDIRLRLTGLQAYRLTAVQEFSLFRGVTETSKQGLKTTPAWELKVVQQGEGPRLCHLSPCRTVQGGICWHRGHHGYRSRRCRWVLLQADLWVGGKVSSIILISIMIIMIIIMVMITNPSHFFFKGWPVAFDQRFLCWERKLSKSLPAILSHVTLLPAISYHFHLHGSTILLDLGCQGTSESAYSARTACTRRSIWITTDVFTIEE